MLASMRAEVTASKYLFMITCSCRLSLSKLQSGLRSGALTLANLRSCSNFKKLAWSFPNVCCLSHRTRIDCLWSLRRVYSLFFCVASKWWHRLSVAAYHSS